MAERTVEGALLISAFGYVYENDAPGATFLVLRSSGRPPTKVAVKSHVEHPVAAEPDATRTGLTRIKRARWYFSRLIPYLGGGTGHGRNGEANNVVWPTTEGE